MSYATMKKRDGFISGGPNTPLHNPDDVTIVGLDEAETDDNWWAHCARLNDVSEEEIREYAEFILASPDRIVQHPVHVRADGARKSIVLDGRTTTRATRLARKLQAERSVPEDERKVVRLIFVEGDDDEAYRVNVSSHRHKPLTRTQEAKQYLEFYKRHGEDLSATAVFFKKSKPTVQAMLDIFKLAPKVQRAIDDNEVPATVAGKLAKLPRSEQVEALKKMKDAGATRGRAADAAVEQLASGKKEVIKDKAPRLRPRKFVEKWLEACRKTDPRTAAILEVVLGKSGPLPKAAAEALKTAGLASDVEVIEEQTEDQQQQPSTPAREHVAETLVNGRANHLDGTDLAIARGIAHYEYFMAGDADALNYVPKIKTLVEQAIAQADSPPLPVEAPVQDQDASEDDEEGDEEELDDDDVAEVMEDEV